MTRCSINQLVNHKKGIVVLWIYFIDIDIINKHSLIFIRFFNEYNIGEPLGVLHLVNKPCLTIYLPPY